VQSENPTRRSSYTWMWVFCAAAAILASTSHWHLRSQAGGFTPSARRQPAQPMELPQLGGGQWNLADHRGQVVLVNYWATWCEPCREELPGLMQVARESAPRDLSVVGVSLDDGPDAHAKVQQFATQYRLPYPIAFPAPAQHFGPGEIAIPTTVLLDRQGRLVKTYTGAVSRSDFAKDVAALLAES
jgi:cytochrome c biogenesis protein CcmG, thiol:disulfide interchange protein DsbE